MNYSPRGVGALCARVLLVIVSAAAIGAGEARGMGTPVLASGTDTALINWAAGGPTFRSPAKIRQRQFGGCMSMITQSASQAISTWVGCVDSTTGATRENSYWRAFNVSDYGIGPNDTYSIASVDVGIFNADAAGPTQLITVNLYAASNFPVGFPASLTLIGTTTAAVTDQSNTVLNVPISAEVPAGVSQIVLEVAVPDGTGAGNIFLMGANSSGETGPSYVTAPFCNVLVPTTTADVGFPTAHWVMNINGSCSTSSSISGHVMYAHNVAALKPVPGTELSGTGLPAVFQATDLEGAYTLSGFGVGSYTITPSKPNIVPSASNGIFSNDAALIARHVVGLAILTPTQLAAARVSGGADLTSLDAALVARWIVGLTTGNNLTGQWKFTPENRHYENIVGDQTGQDYTALLMGDVSGDWTPPAARSLQAGRTSFIWETAAVSVPNLKAQGTAFAVPVRLDNLRGRAVSSFQFDVEFDPAVISPADVAADLTGTMAAGLTVVSNSPRPGLLKVAVYGTTDVYGDGTYVHLLFRRIGRLKSSPVTITNFRLNDGSDRVTVALGSVTLQ